MQGARHVVSIAFGVLLASCGWSLTDDSQVADEGSEEGAARVSCPNGTHREGNKCVADDTAAPSTPAGLSATAASSSQIALSWSASTDNTGVTGYRVFRGTTQIATVTGTSYQDSGLSPSTSYSYQVSAVDAAGNLSAKSSSASATTLAPPASGYNAAYAAVAPTIDGSLAEWGAVAPITFGEVSGRSPASLDNSASVKLLWDATYLYVAFSVTDSELQAVVTTADGSGMFRDDAVELYIDTLNNGGTAMQTDDYQFLVNIANPSQTTDQRGTGSGKDNTWDSAGFVQAVSRSGTLNGGTLGTDTGYSVEMAIKWSDLGVSASGGKILGVDLAVDDRDDNGVTPASFDWAGLSLYGNPGAWPDVTLTGGPSAGDTSAPSVPGGVAASAVSASQINLSWSASTDNVGVSDYKIYRGAAGAAPTYLTTVAGSVTSLQDTGLAASTSYAYKVQALDAAGNSSALSAAASATTSGTSSSYVIFNPADYAGYDPTGANESSAAFQTAIDKASQYASVTTNSGLYIPPEMKNAAGTTVGPNAPQAIVRANPNGVYKLSRVYIKSNVRVEIDASSTLIPVQADQQVMLYMSQTAATGQTYVRNVTLSSYGSSATFRDRGRRCTNAGLTSPCNITKSVLYSAMKFPDGSGWASGDTALARRFVVDLDYRRYPDSDPPAASGNGPRGSGLKARQVQYFLVEKFLELAHPGEMMYPDDNPPGPGGIGSNTYPATAGNGLAIDASDTPTGASDNFTESAVQARNGTARYLHCENCTRGYGIIEIHAGVDLEYRYISTRGGIGVRWESAGNGQSTRQTAQQIVGYDCNNPMMMSAHLRNQRELRASFIKSISCDNGYRSETAGGDTFNSSVSDLDVYAADADDSGNKAQVILCRSNDTVDGCAKYVSGYDDDAWLWKQPERAVYNHNARTTSSITLSRIRCTPRSTFVFDNVGYGACSGL
jgi:chitodextrinase